MQMFEHINPKGKCLICGTNDDGVITLIPIDGTKDGLNAEAEQVHVSCLALNFNKEIKVIYQKLSKGGAII